MQGPLHPVRPVPGMSTSRTSRQTGWPTHPLLPYACPVTPVELSRTVLRAVRRAVEDGELRVVVPEKASVTVPGAGGWGDYATNIALQLARPAGRPPAVWPSCCGRTSPVPMASAVSRSPGPGSSTSASGVRRPPPSSRRSCGADRGTGTSTRPRPAAAMTSSPANRRQQPEPPHSPTHPQQREHAHPRTSPHRPPRSTPRPPRPPRPRPHGRHRPPPPLPGRARPHQLRDPPRARVDGDPRCRGRRARHPGVGTATRTRTAIRTGTRTRPLDVNVRPVPAPDPVELLSLGRDAARWALLHPAAHDRPRLTADHLVQRESNPSSGSVTPTPAPGPSAVTPPTSASPPNPATYDRTHTKTYDRAHNRAYDRTHNRAYESAPPPTPRRTPPPPHPPRRPPPPPRPRGSPACSRPARPSPGRRSRRGPSSPRRHVAARGRETLGRPPCPARACRSCRGGARRWPVPARHRCPRTPLSARTDKTPHDLSARKRQKRRRHEPFRTSRRSPSRRRSARGALLRPGRRPQRTRPQGVGADRES